MDREADATVPESDRLHSQLSRFEDMFPGYADWGSISDVAVPFDGDSEFCPDLGPEGYRGRDVIPYGDAVVVETGIGKLTVDTSALPVDPGSAVS
ncbi:hypothetical protein ACFY7H_19320 [Streptomyces sp. NPDC012794]|uniref:hypothetical protein n=1 Tax=Streptomyces sp. NPDC012794 TaxID=3364850 RepID=UPI003686BE25